MDLYLILFFYQSSNFLIIVVIKFYIYKELWIGFFLLNLIVSLVNKLINLVKQGVLFYFFGEFKIIINGQIN